ncbi:MAG: hypothetical protein IPP96_18005 [Chitinophagaceae bacterium]|nr:hypothetical protein [Chitinophagaceae bacterium]
MLKPLFYIFQLSSDRHCNTLQQKGTEINIKVVLIVYCRNNRLAAIRQYDDQYDRTDHVDGIGYDKIIVRIKKA